MTSQPQVVEIDLSAVESLAELHVALQQQLHFPDFYGRNWDAFWDAITGLVELPSQVRLLGWQGFEARFPHDARLLRECLTDYQRELGACASAIEYA